MENLKQQLGTKDLSAFESIRIKKQTKVRFKKLLVSINKKDFGSKIMSDDLLAVLIDKLTPSDIQSLQTSSLSNEDRTELLRKKFIMINGPTTKDEFFGFMLSPKFPEFLRDHSSEVFK